MKAFSIHITAAALIVAGLSGCAGTSAANPLANPAVDTAAQPAKKSFAAKKTMRAFRSEQELKSYFHEIAAKQKTPGHAGGVVGGVLSSVAAPSAVASADKASVAESVTNVQHAGVDEGGIVKVHGNHLVMLRRGRLFTVAIGDGALEPISAVDAYAPDVDPSGTWYDEMLIAGDTIAVIGYSYSRGGTEVNLFQVDAAGVLSYK
jgi:uncharacterized secreted protein with C-terminal beta-propeller domain